MERKMIKLSNKEPAKSTVDLLVYFLPRQEKELICLNEHLSRAVDAAWQAGDFTGKAEETLLLYPEKHGREAWCLATRILVVGLGKIEKERKTVSEQLRVAAGTAAARARKLKAREVLVVIPDFLAMPPDESAECLAEGLVLGNYIFSKYKKPMADEDPPARVKNFIFYGEKASGKQITKGFKRGAAAAAAACIARDMANEPGNYWTPEQFARSGQSIAGRTGMKCTVLDKTAMKKLGMGGILAVNQGSAVPARLVILEYMTDTRHPTLLLVGKGLTFDSGGISLKPASGMQDMKYDMCGGAAVMAAMQGIAEEKPSGINVVALIPATDNMSGSAALKPGDIITQYSGKTVEIVNTDAEGRLILADALAYGIDCYRPDAVIDVATLTGAVIVGLGHHRTGLLGNNDALAAQVLEAGDLTGEPLWRLPLGPEYTKQLDSEIADLKNVGDRTAGTITAACFLQQFVGDTPWAHLDIAGTAWGFTEKPYIKSKGPTGTATRTLLLLVRNWRPLESREMSEDR